MTGLLHDLRYAIRQLHNSPGFAAVTILTLALGIGANTAIFSLINTIMLRTLPVKNPAQLVELNWVSRGDPMFHNSYNWGGCLVDRASNPESGCSFAYPLFEQVRAQRSLFSGVFAFVPRPLTMNFGGRISQIDGLYTSGDFFPTLGAHAALGRLLSPADDSPQAAPVMVISYRFWRTVLGSDTTVIGNPVWVGKIPVTLVGVASPGFLDLDPGVRTDFWVPLSLQPAINPYFPKRDTKYPWLELMARLRPGVTTRQAEAAVSTIFSAYTTSGPEPNFKPADRPRIVLPAATRGLAYLRHQFSRPLFTLLGAVGAVLLLACANLAGLMLARATARRKEVAVRAALGASRFRIVSQLLTEGILLSLVGGIAGIVLGYWGAQALAAFLSSNWYSPLQLDVRLDAHVLGFTFLTSLLVGVLAGLAPALSRSHVELVPELKESPRRSGATFRGRIISTGGALVIFQMALAMLVMAGAGLLVRTLANLRAVNPGFDPQNLVLFYADTTFSTRTEDGLKRLGSDLQQQLAALPGVRSVSYSQLGMIASGNMEYTLDAIGEKKSLQENVNWFPVGPDFFRTMQIPLLSGLTLNEQDVRSQKSLSSYASAVVNESFARRYFGNQNPVGQHFHVEGHAGDTEIVGLVGNAKQMYLRQEITPTVYVPILYVPVMHNVGEFEVRTAMNPNAMMPEIRAAVARFDPSLLITDMKTQLEQIDQNIYQERLIANLSSLFALLALIVACIGIYGLLSYQVTRRTREIGIRLALGAQREDVLRLVMRQGAWLAVLGVGIGMAGALGLTRYLRSFLFGVKPSDPLTVLAVAGLLIGVALLASYIPARRAAKVEPMEALRYE